MVVDISQENVTFAYLSLFADWLRIGKAYEKKR